MPPAALTSPQGRRMTVAVLGLGRMGGAMARRLADVGHELVLYNRSAERAREIAEATGAEVAGTAREAAEAATICVVSLADDAAVLDVYRDPEGLVAGLQPGSVVCDTSTVAPETARQVAAAVRKRGAAYLDTPVSGSVPLVESGTLTVMVGGDADALERARPVLDGMASTVFHLGDVGAGATMKLVVNSVVHSLNVALSEALVLAERSGIDRAQAYDVVQVSAIGAPFVKYKRAAFLEPETAPVAFSLDLVAKDQDLIAALARDVDARWDQGQATRALVAEAVSKGLGQRDMSAVAGLLRE
jgi:3-hydroxyisobutyrate dehydrogenase/2-hydroxy-3-oxopropionate reductase